MRHSPIVRLQLGTIALVGIWMLTGVQAEPAFAFGNKIRSCQRINHPGSYELARNLRYGAGRRPSPPTACLEIRADNVTIDFRGFTMTGDPAAEFVSGVRADGVSGLALRNGTITGFGEHGIRLTNTERDQISGMKIDRNGRSGILSAGEFSIIRDNVVTVFGNGGTGISTGSRSLVTGNISVGSDGRGVETGPESVVTDNVTSGHGVAGIMVGIGSVVRGNTANNNGGLGGPDNGGIVAECPSTIIGNTAIGNSGSNLRLTPAVDCVSVDNAAP